MFESGVYIRYKKKKQMGNPTTQYNICHFSAVKKKKKSQECRIDVFPSPSLLECVQLSPAGSMTDSDGDWAELGPIERGCVQLIEFMSEYFLSCRLSSGKPSCIHLEYCSHCKSP